MEAVINFLTGQAEIIGTVTAVICVILIMKQNPLNFPIGIIKDFFLLYVFIKYTLWASTFSQIVLISLSFYGWYKWLRGGENQSELKVSRLELKEAIICLAVLIFGSLGLATVLIELAHRGIITQPSFVYWDSSITMAIFIAYWLMARKKLENWLVWLIFVNLQYLILNPLKGLYFFTFLQVIYITLAILGFNTWLKDLRKNEIGNLASDSA
jgi:nicotinamide mononucleotide transporter